MSVQKPDLLSTTAQIKHSSRKLANAQSIQATTEKEHTRLSEKLAGLKRDLDLVKAEAEKAAEKQRRESKVDLRLSEESLREYRKLYVLGFLHFEIGYLTLSLQESISLCPSYRRKTELGNSY